ncbi:Adenylate kinase [Aquirufa nivalisilvae]|uniref:Adenylate kinase n=2 Tax=Aquirufa nivalisilvae TaxID=2516557 RepID=A0A2S2DX25_9BACT|nr:Adenylate kinase [Aquirufa nivalisilvae]
MALITFVLQFLILFNSQPFTFFMLNLVLFGPPGAGKGTQSAKLIDKYGLIHLSTGDLLRAEITAGTSLGLEAKKLMDQGILVPDSVVIGMIENKLNENKGAAGFIFDGFPRTVAQAEALDTLLEGHQLSIKHMISLEVNQEELTQRLLERGKTSGRPDDQNEELIRKRVQEYGEKTAPVAGHYASQGKFQGINGIGEIEEIFGQIVRIIEG